MHKMVVKETNQSGGYGMVMGNSASDEVIAKAQAIGAFLNNLGIPLTAAALQFPLRHPAVTSVLTGSRNSKELLSNIADFDLELPADIWSQLEDANLIERIS